LEEELVNYQALNLERLVDHMQVKLAEMEELEVMMLLVTRQVLVEEELVDTLVLVDRVEILVETSVEDSLDNLALVAAEAVEVLLVVAQDIKEVLAEVLEFMD
jgi:hypothetical protein